MIAGSADTFTVKPGSDQIVGNKQSSLELRWIFGGKPQQGWSLYAPLVMKTIGAESDVADKGFAESVARWQSARGLQSTGIIDEPTWSMMITGFQAARSGERSSPSSDELITISPVEFYDPQRPAELRQAERETYAAYKAMIAAAAKDTTLGLRSTGGGLDPEEKYLKIISAFRSPEYQAQLRKLAPQAGRAALAVNSPHSTGRALDLYVGGEPVNTADNNRRVQTNTAAYKWLVKNAGRFGFRPYFYEPWHWEYHP